jgi:hypothetical protein
MIWMDIFGSILKTNLITKREKQSADIGFCTQKSAILFLFEK